MYKKILELLDGKKTYVAAVFTAILNLLVSAGIIKIPLETVAVGNFICALFIGLMRMFARKPGPLAPPVKIPVVGEVKE